MSSSDTTDTSPTRRGLDTLGLRDATLGLGDQVAAAVAVGEAIEGLPPGEEVANVLVLGMGSSAMAGVLRSQGAAGADPVMRPSTSAT